MSNDNKSTEHGAGLPRTNLKDDGSVRRYSFNHETGTIVETDRGMWVRYVDHLAATSEKPAAAAERGAVGQWERSADGRHLYSNSFSYDVKLTLDGDWETPSQRIGYAVKLLSILNATPPAQAAEPAQVDEVHCPYCADAPVMREQMACGSCGEVVVTMGQYGRNFAALTQRPAAPLATDAGVGQRIAELSTFRPAALLYGVTMLRDVKVDEFGWLRRSDVLEALAAHPAAERPAQGEVHEIRFADIDDSFLVLQCAKVMDAKQRLQLAFRDCQGVDDAKAALREAIARLQVLARAPEGCRNDTEQA